MSLSSLKKMLNNLHNYFKAENSATSKSDATSFCEILV